MLTAEGAEYAEEEEIFTEGNESNEGESLTTDDSDGRGFLEAGSTGDNGDELLTAEGAELETAEAVRSFVSFESPK